MSVLLCAFVCLFPLNVLDVFIYTGGSPSGVVSPCTGWGTSENVWLFSCHDPVGGISLMLLASLRGSGGPPAPRIFWLQMSVILRVRIRVLLSQYFL